MASRHFVTLLVLSCHMSSESQRFFQHPCNNNDGLSFLVYTLQWVPVFCFYVRLAAGWSSRLLEFWWSSWESLESLEQFLSLFQIQSLEACSSLCLEWLQQWGYPTSRWTQSISQHIKLYLSFIWCTFFYSE